jgi:hypothetical protein
MRILALLLTAGLCLLTSGCGTAPKRSSIHYSPPSVDPFRQKVTATQEFITTAQTHGGRAKQEIVLAIKLVPSGADPQLLVHLNQASRYVDLFTEELLKAQGSLKEAQDKLGPLQKKIEAQTESLNTANDDKNAALDQVRDLKHAAVLHEKKYHRLKFGVCTLAAAGAVFLASKLGLFGLLRKLSLLGPWGMVAGIAGAVAIPGIIFGALWLFL